MRRGKGEEAGRSWAVCSAMTARCIAETKFPRLPPTRSIPGPFPPPPHPPAHPASPLWKGVKRGPPSVSHVRSCMRRGGGGGRPRSLAGREHWHLSHAPVCVGSHSASLWLTVTLSSSRYAGFVVHIRQRWGRKEPGFSKLVRPNGLLSQSQGSRAYHASTSPQRWPNPGLVFDISRLAEANSPLPGNRKSI